MKIGLSFSKCVKDIVEGTVDIDDVLVVVSGTRFDFTDSEAWMSIFDGYSRGGYSAPVWRGMDYDDVYKVVDLLWTSGKLHQPRNFGSYPMSGGLAKRIHWLEAIIDPTLSGLSESEKEAWDQYKFITGLSGKVVNT